MGVRNALGRQQRRSESMKWGYNGISALGETDSLLTVGNRVTRVTEYVLALSHPTKIMLFLSPSFSVE